MAEWHFTVEGADATDPVPPNLASLLLSHGSMELEWYRPDGTDPQQPHDQDELYFVARGAGRFVREGVTVDVSVGDVLFVPAGMEHRFIDFSDDFATWVVFWGPVGGDTGSA